MIAVDARAYWKSKYQIDLQGRYASRMTKLRENLSNQYSLEAHQDFQSAPTSFRFGFRATTEGAYASNPDRYSQEFAQRNSSDFRLRDNYYEYFSDSLMLRLGYQQIVWGEAFGSFFADVVNPKDLREIGLNSLSQQRMQIPLANLKWIAKNWSYQLLWIPIPEFNRNPDPGGDYFLFPAEQLGVSASQITVANDVLNEQNETRFKSEFGTKLGFLLGNWDFSLFALNAYDRAPYYTSQVVSFFPPTIELQAHTVMYPLYGITLTNDFELFLLRSEVIFHNLRPIQSLKNGQLGFHRADHWVGVIGLDFTQIENWPVSLQWSFDQINSTEESLLKKKRSQMGQARIAREWRKFKWEFSDTHFFEDRGYLLQTKLTLVMGRATEIDFGVDFFDGPADSQAAQLRDKSRAMITLRIMDAG